ncbi:phosphoglycerate mutase-like protein [Saccharata proteae CBS 121410]|uniref:Phosphoglycerate mutase-like protein n=1 Tax=Saccharata proteae CBS 121410 TaxID=1314787 RepID=A0A6A5YDD8_9PEZI|nr:phosphoglycerate mutase-like protein [Saccharata proteae CBS 121410]
MRRRELPSLCFAAWLVLSAAVVRADIVYNVHAAVVLTRNGERTPLLTGNSQYDVAHLTALGAQQAHAQGTALRQRYLSSAEDYVNLGPTASISGLSRYSLDNNQLYIGSTDDEYMTATAQAFIQGLYPPYALNQTAASTLDSEDVLANSSYIEAPLGGYQYPNIRSFSALDPSSVFVAGSQNCRQYGSSAVEYFSSSEFGETRDRTRELYHDVGVATLYDVLPEERWDYSNAMAISEYLSYMYEHDVGVRAVLEGNATLRGSFERVRYLADHTSATDSIRSIAGRTLAGKVVDLLQTTVATGGTANKLSLLFSDHPAFTSFFSLASLPKSNASDFYGLPSHASSLVFELYSFDNDTSPGNGAVNNNANAKHVPATNTTTTTFPPAADLWLRFSFRNGTAASDSMIAYPLFNRGPSETDMPWPDFVSAMQAVMVADAGVWCQMCDAWSLFCPAFGVTGTMGVARLRSGGAGGAGDGGFKGGAKMSSDVDVVLPKSPVAVTVDAHPKPGTIAPRERVGSWEMRTGPREKAVSNPLTEPTPGGKVFGGDCRYSSDSAGTDDAFDGVSNLTPVEPVLRV